MNIGIIGARGCVGSALITQLLRTTKHTIIASYRDKEESPQSSEQRIAWRTIDLESDESVERFLCGVDVLVYLVHSLDSAKFESLDRKFAKRVGRMAKKCNVQKIIYLGGIIPLRENLSAHLKSRKETGEALTHGGVPVAEVRASILLGRCSASYRMVYGISKRMPILIMPSWSKAKCSPIAMTDAVEMLIALIEHPIKEHEIFEIGAEGIGYDELVMQSSYIARGRQARIIYVPIFPITLAAHIIERYTQVPWQIAQALMGSLKNDSMATRDRFKEITGKTHESIDVVLKRLHEETLRK